MSSDDDLLRLATLSPASFAHVVSGGLWVPYEHLILLNDYLLRVEAGEIDRLIVTMPPRHGKSELISRYLPAWYLGKHPDRQVLLVCYGKELAEDHGNAARHLLQQWGPQLFGVQVKDNSAGRWRVEDHKGMMIARSLRGEITGRGGHLFIIDDPIKDELDAQSEIKRERVWSWWQSTARTRLQLMGGTAAAIVVQTRWHEDDLAGRLMQTGRWTVLNLPALAEADDELGRDEGNALCPELIDEDGLAEIRAETGSYFFAALYQQRPAPAEGIMFRRSDFRYYRTEEVIDGPNLTRFFVIPREDDEGDRHIDAGQCTYFQTVDVAISAKTTADFTVVSSWAITPARDLLLLDVQRRRFEDQQLIEFLKRASDDHGRPHMYVERFGAGRSPLHWLSRAGYPVSQIPAEAGTQQDKVTRATGAVAAYERHAVFHPYPYPEWLEAYEDELVSFPHASHDDQVDTVSYAARLLPNLGTYRPPAQVEPQVRPRPLSAGVRGMRV